MEKEEFLTRYRRIYTDICDSSPSIGDRGRELGKRSNYAHNRLYREIYSELKEVGASTTAFLRNFYCYAVSMIETRDRFHPYNEIEYSRRNGEMWEKFATLCLISPDSNINEVSTEANNNFRNKITQSIENMAIQNNGNELLKFKAFILSLVDSINLDIDFVGQKNGKLIGIDFKSGFSSNEKGNTTRILKVGAAYSFAEIDIKLYLLVRQSLNNSYLDKISESSDWEVHTGINAYRILEELSGQNLRSFVEQEVQFMSDFLPAVGKSLRNNITGIEKYTQWL